ncbi:unnamed protein product, partial [Rotaria sp. Silwood2]
YPLRSPSSTNIHPNARLQQNRITVAGGNRQGNGINQLSKPLGLYVDNDQTVYVADQWNHRIVEWKWDATSGQVVAGGNGQGSGAHQNHEVRRYRRGESQGTVVGGGNGSGNRLDQLSYPRYVFVDRDHSVYVSDEGNHRVMKLVKGAKQGIVVAGGEGEGNGLTQLSYPYGVVVDQLGTVYVADWGND